MAVVVLAFAASLWASHLPLSRVGDRTGDIVRNALPSIQHLARARTSLIRISDAVLEDDVSPRSTLRTRIDAARAALDNELGSYLSLPVSAEERQRFSVIPREVRELDEAISALLAESSAMTTPVPRDAAVARRSLVSRIEVIDGSLTELIELNAKLAVQEAGGIEKAWRRASTLAPILGFLCVVAASVATALGIRAARTNERLVAERQSLIEERAHELDAFAGRVAHDLKNPLHVLSLRLATLRSGGLPPAAEQEASFARVQAEVRRMNEIIDGLLEFARAGTRSGSPERTRLVGVVAEVLAAEQEAIRATAVHVTSDVGDGVEVACARAAVFSVVSNLVHNAVKYVVEGSGEPPTVTICARSSGSNTVRIEVRDNGPGVPEPDRDRVFEPFARSATSQPGTGLGLATVKRIVQAYGGKLGVETTVGAGSCFWCELPRASGSLETEHHPSEVTSFR